MFVSHMAAGNQQNDVHYAAILEWTFGSGTKITLVTSLATSLNLMATSLNLMETSLNFETQLNHTWTL